MSAKVPARFTAKVRAQGECLVWTGGLTNNGYGRFKVNGKTVVAHRFIYELVHGPITDGLQLDHLCRNRACVYVAHLEAVTPRVNVLRGDTVSAANAAKTHCVRGHELSGENLMRRGADRRRCRTCHNACGRRNRATDAFRAKHAAYERARRAMKKERGHVADASGGCLPFVRHVDSEEGQGRQA